MAAAVMASPAFAAPCPPQLLSPRALQRSVCGGRPAAGRLPAGGGRRRRADPRPPTLRHPPADGPCMKASSSPPATVLPTDGGATEEAATAFAAALDGEWNGFQAKVDPVTGAALKIPAIEVPDDFAEWNVHPVGYATTTSIKLRKAALYVKRSSSCTPPSRSTRSSRATRR